MSGKSLLLVGHDQILMDVSKRILERTGYVVRCAARMDDARVILKDFSPDAIILNKNLPDGNGLDILCQLREECNKPILFISDSKEDEVAAFKMGATEFLSQPYNYDVLETRIRLAIDRAAGADMPHSSKEPELRSDEHEADAMPAMAAYDGQKEIIGQEPTRSKRKSHAVIGRNIAVVCVFILVIGVGLFPVIRWISQETIAFDEQVPLVEMPFNDNITDYTGRDNGQTITVPGIDKVAIRSGTTNLEVPLFNSRDNSCYLVFEIILRDSGETIFKSGMIEPGETVERVTISKGLTVGEYNALLIIHTFSSEDGTSDDGSISVDFILSVL